MLSNCIHCCRELDSDTTVFDRGDEDATNAEELAGFFLMCEQQNAAAARQNRLDLELHQATLWAGAICYLA